MDVEMERDQWKMKKKRRKIKKQGISFKSMNKGKRENMQTKLWKKKYDVQYKITKKERRELAEIGSC